MSTKGINKHNLNIDDIIDMLVDGKSFREIASGYGCSVSQLHKYCYKVEHSARVMAALNSSANAVAEKAEEVLLNAPSNLAEISRARELAQYYKWLSAKRNPKQFSDKYIQEIDMTTTNKVIKVIVPDEDSDTSNDEDVNQ